MVYSSQTALVVFLTTVLLGGCSVSGVAKNDIPHWQDKEQILLYAHNLQIGDVLITPKDPLIPISWWGHSAVIVDDDLSVAEYPKLGVGYIQTPIDWWFKYRSSSQVLRYKKFTPTFRDQFIKNLQQTQHADYTIEYDNQTLLEQPIDQVGFYCSSYVWYLYAKTAKDLGYSLDIDADGGSWVMPYDLLKSQEFYTVFKK